MQTRLRTAAIVDEFSPTDLERAAAAMSAIGMDGAELRVVFGKNIMDLDDGEIRRACDILAKHGLSVVSLSSPLLKCVLPDAPEVDHRFQQDVFGSTHTFADQPRLAERAFQIAEITGARIIRVFSYWRTVAPEQVFDRVAAALARLAGDAASQGITIGLENEHACSIGTAAEAARLLNAVPHPNLKLVWDPANAFVAGEKPFPDGFRKLPVSRIAHVHAKDCFVDGHTPCWGPLGCCGIDWKGQIAALISGGYNGYISLETHWPGPQNDKFNASVICGWNLKYLVMG
ncbi:MAG: sugar phosphate isomerase/epimerase family protein [bacterium]|jgi:sugar phosphate isomerase/epimerase